MRYYCGLDLGSRSCQVCVLDENGEQLINKKVPNDIEQILEVLEDFKEASECVVESTFNWYWLVDGLQEAGYDICLAHTLGLSMITKAKVKTDRRDARTLAKLLKADMIPKAYIYPKKMRPARDLVRYRCRLVRQRATCYGAIRRLLYQHGVMDHSRNSVKELDCTDLEALFSHPLVRLHGEHELMLIDMYTTLTQEMEDLILGGLKRRAAYKRLMTIPGVGRILAVTLYFEVGDVGRFENARHFSSYCRVVPGVAQSSGVTRRGRGSKQGNPYLKWTLCEAATMGRRYNKKLRRLYDRCLAQHTGPGQKMIANNVVAHKLAVAVYHVLRDKVEYREELLFGN